MVRAAVVAGFVLALAASCPAQEHIHGSSEKLGSVNFSPLRVTKRHRGISTVR